jgi:hypothetical protein
VVPQLAAPAFEHVPVGSVPPGSTGVHVPTLPGTTHDMQVPVQALLQQTPPWPQKLL